MRLEETAEEYISGIPMWAGKKNSLEAIRAFLERMDNPDEKQRIIHVAGTNGKGSVCAYITSMLLEGGCHTGTFVSPHLVETRERFLVDGVPIRKELFEDSYRRVRELSERLMKEGFCHPTYFEFLFYMGMDVFHRETADYTILETGLGGLLDTTNVVRKPLVTVITSIGLDHMEYLGDTVEKIAWQKAGIIKPGVPVVYERKERLSAAVIEERAAACGSPVYPVDRQGYLIRGYEAGGIRASLKRLDGSFLDVVVSSQAEYQVMNALTALRAMELLGERADGCRLSDKALRRGIEAMRWPGRMEEVLPGFYLDGAHNPDGVKEFIRTALRLCKERGKRAFLLFSAVSDKAHQAMIREIAKELPLDRVAVAHIRSERGLDEAVLESEFKAVSDCSVCTFATAEEAVRELMSWQDEKHLAFCVGSLYLMGEIKAILRGGIER